MLQYLTSKEGCASASRALARVQEKEILVPEGNIAPWKHTLHLPQPLM